MAAIRFVICFAAVLIQTAYTTPANYIGFPVPYNQASPCRFNVPNPIIERPGCSNRFPVESLGSFTSSAPLSLSIRSENSYQGLVDVRGRLPFQGTVGLNGLVPSAGEGVVSYGIGDSVAIAEVPIASAYVPGVGAYGPGVAAYGPGVAAYSPGVAAYDPSLAGCGRKSCNYVY